MSHSPHCHSRPFTSLSEPEILWNRLHTCSNATRYACRAWCYREAGETLIHPEAHLLAVLDEISEELFFQVSGSPRVSHRRETFETLEVWAFELEQACEECSVNESNEDIDTLVRLFAEGCRLAKELFESRVEENGMDYLLEFLDLVSVHALSMVVSQPSTGGLLKKAA